MLFFLLFSVHTRFKFPLEKSWIAILLQVHQDQAEVLIVLSEKVIISLKTEINPKCNLGMAPLRHAAEYGCIGTHQLIQD